MPSKGSKKACDVATAKIGFVGAGKLAESIISGLVVYGKVDPKRIHVAAPSSNNTDRLKQSFQGLKVSKRNLDIFGKFDCDIIFLAVNGSVIRNLYKLGGSRPAPLTTNYIPNMKHPLYVLSLITGFEIKVIKDCLLNPEHPEKYMLEMHRIMLNCAAAFGLGVCAVDVEPDSKKLAEPVRALLSLVAKLEYIPEAQMDAACALCGSGLSFSYYFINAMSDGALKIGLSRAAAVKFSAKTVNCATQTLLESGKHPNELKDEVCAPSGGAIYGLSILDKADVASGVSGAVEAAYKRALSLAREDNPA
ncbi:PREDICTED: pyrroline-5-carboxylate reductase 3-like [Rhagoletis zephyria]|uniref:pyrroline-5-carboxylate reductase 3-like n=1 Tax=Rhagoletis zephyria TaxID=28612 RepID=UPI00081170EF|nr:PREDICTED: pyrroline-5-carboxylate reductase 3-like [Rhagoletis zephyria]KAH9388751.1 hypothetical protein TYRP_008096 [Tyrophagus putrescentiae]